MAAATAAAAAAGQRTYVDFVPPHRLVEERDNKTLVIDVSAAGFKKEQLKVQIDKYGRLRISGERPVSGNQWSRFYKEYDVPEGCNASDVRARYDKGGLLHIIMPRLSAAAAAAVAEEEEPRAAAGAKTSQGASAAGHGAAQQTPARGEEKDKEEEEGTKRRDDQGEDEHTSHGGGGDDDGGRGEAAAAGLVMGRRTASWRALLAVVVALLVGAGLYAKYRLMDPTVEPAPANAGHFFGLSDH